MLILPIATDRYCRQFPYVTVALIVINALVLALKFTRLAMLRQATVLKERLRHPAADQLFDQFLTRFPHSQYRAYAAAKKAGGS
jgi:outer membrane protein assembly factor BamD (BamD/ComL family)